MEADDYSLRCMAARVKNGVEGQLGLQYLFLVLF